MKTKPLPVSDEEIQKAFAGTNFGTTEYRKLLNSSVLKKLVGYHCGHTITCIMQELNLIGKTGKPTERGIELVRQEFGYLMVFSG